MIVFLDTNVLLHYDFEQINWESELGAPVRQVVICWVNVEELDRLKENHPQDKTTGARSPSTQTGRTDPRGGRTP